MCYLPDISKRDVGRPGPDGLNTMAPFEPPEVVLTGFKDKIEALTLQGISVLRVICPLCLPIVKETAFT